MQQYVVGFLIDVNKNVVLIRKNKPMWQAGKLNGVGGKVEHGEDAMTAMIREFTEEAGVIFKDWSLFATLTENNEYELFCFKGFVEDVTQIEVKSMTTEIIEVHNIHTLFSETILPSAMWMITMALDQNAKNVKIAY